jgi:long-chain acyl-CoA synthetase
VSSSLHYPYQNFYEILEHNAYSFSKDAIVFEDKITLNNQTLKAQVDQFARFLEYLGVKQGDKVALILANSKEFVIAFFAIGKLGAVCVPINNFLKSEELEFILQNVQASLLITGIKFEKELQNIMQKSSVKKTVWVDKADNLEANNFYFYEALTNQSDFSGHTKQSIQVKLDDLAVIIYTSGTTGTPKGAMLSYRNIFSNMIAGSQAFEVSKKDRFIVYLPMFHSFTLTVMVLLPIFNASAIVIVKSIFPFSNVLKQVLLKRVTVFLGAPTIYNALIKAKIPWYFMWFHNLRVFISGSAPLSKQVLDDFQKKFTRVPLVEGYGLSECSPAVAVNRLDKQKALSVGLPLASYEVKVVDDNAVEVPIGEVGELIVKGDNVMQGYYNLPEETDKTIINGWLQTGDFAKLDEEGYVYIVDRKKDLIISKGINIYPREIEELIYKIESVDACAVVGIKDEETADESVVAFIQLKEEVKEKPSEREIKTFLKPHLANFKMPKHIYFVEELPKNATGKVLKRKLKEEIENFITF